ncbi:Metacaspase-1 [Seminavis robusta]|uniref:Metacaspase-1 n=1 Tax=Seminavis robusta TaxID=568900 RepID=A0A9N8H9D1_9STRA|nr:Metacaspase-1 [Seminavis robusta]|eukprot:Sro114_g056360.1 Metacaspase-1 (482) ;mRNA; r:43767-45394
MSSSLKRALRKSITPDIDTEDNTNESNLATPAESNENETPDTHENETMAEEDEVMVNSPGEEVKEEEKDTEEAKEDDDKQEEGEDGEEKDQDGEDKKNAEEDGEAKEEDEAEEEGKFVFEGRNPKLIKGKVSMISGCMDIQTSTDIGDISETVKHLTPAGLGGGALTSVLIDTLTAHKKAGTKPSKMEVIKELKAKLEDLDVTQRPQISTSSIVDLSEPFEFVPSDCSGVRRAVVIGINYTGTSNELRGCHNDAINLKAFLMEEQGFDEDNITMLLDDGKETNPTKLNIMMALHHMVQSSKSGDFCFMSYSGHGDFIVDRSGDEKDGWDEVLCAVDHENVVDDELWETVVSKLKTGVTLFGISDSCHSGTVMDLPYRYQFAEDSEVWDEREEYVAALREHLAQQEEEEEEEEEKAREEKEKEKAEEEAESSSELDDQMLAMTAILMMMQVNRKMSKTKVKNMKKKMNAMMAFFGGDDDDDE